MTNLGSWSYGIAAAAFVVLSLLLLTSWRGRLQGGLLSAATACTALWAVANAALAAGNLYLLLPVNILEVLRTFLWALFLLKLLNTQAGWHGLFTGWARWWTLSLVLLGGGLVATVTALMIRPNLDISLRTDIPLFGHTILTVLGLVLVEQLFRNTRAQNRWAIKYLCFGVGGLYAYDFFLYSDALLFKRIDPDLWQARGFINAFVAPFVAVSAARNPEWSLDVFVSRRIVFHTAAVAGAGIYLLAMAVGGAYIRFYGGSWGNFAEAVFLFGAFLVLLVLMFSGQFQARLKVFLNKHFFNYKYDYREEWLRLIRTLSDHESAAPLRERAVSAIANLMDSPGGALWWKRDTHRYELVGHWNMSEVSRADEPLDGSLARFLRERGWVLNLEEFDSQGDLYRGLELPLWLQELQRAWLVVPLVHHEGLAGFVVLTRPRAPRHCNWEDNDLLKTAGRQVAGNLAQLEAAEALVEARQFEAFNRLSAFLIHDLKNVVAQLSLIVANAERHQHKPEFIADAFKTVAHSVGKINNMLAPLRSGKIGMGNSVPIDLFKLLGEVVLTHSGTSPVPVLKCSDQGLIINAERERLADVLGHVIQNAQEATSPLGSVEITLEQRAGMAVIEVKDTGCGMDAAFIRDRLFRPFDSTKGRSGMGIGAYEAREFVRELGGRVDVDSKPGLGTVFRIWIPLRTGRTLQEGL